MCADAAGAGLTACAGAAAAIPKAASPHAAAMVTTTLAKRELRKVLDETIILPLSFTVESEADMKAAFRWQGMARIYSRGRGLARVPVLAPCGTDVDRLRW